MSECEGGDMKPNKEDEKCGRKDRPQSDVVLRKIEGGKEESGGVTNYYCDLFLFFFNLNY